MISAAIRRMKNVKNFFMIIALLVLVPAIFPAVPGDSAKAEGNILTSHPVRGPVGTTVEVEGVCFTPSVLCGITSNVTRISQVDIYFPDKNTLYKTEVIDTWGKLNTTVVIDEVPAGTYQIWVHDGTAGAFAWVSIPFTVEPKIELSRRSGYVGDGITISGNGFAPLSSIPLYFGNRSIDTFYTDEKGSFHNRTFIVPDSVNDEYDIKAVDRRGNEAVVKFTSQRQKIVIFPNAGSPGTDINLIGTGFVPDKTITFKMYNAGTIVPELTTNPETVKTDDWGSFDACLKIPACTSDTYIIEAYDGDARSGTTLIVSSSGVFDRNIGFIGSNVTFSGNGFLPYRYTVAYFDGIPLAEAKADQHGGSSISFVIPPCVPGDEHVVSVTDGVSTYSYDFIVLPKAKAEINRTIAEVGSEIIMSGSGFIANKVAMISLDGDSVTEIPVGTDESFTTSFPVPACTPGVKVISVTDGINRIELTLSVESQVLPPVAPVTPDKQSSIGTNIILAWEPLQDFSDITYHVQITHDPSFGPDSILMQKAGISEIQYIFNMEPAIQSGVPAGSFFWRIRAESTAGAAGAWSETREFVIVIPEIIEAGSNNFLTSYGLLFELGALVLLLLYWYIRKKRKAKASAGLES